LTSKLTIDGQTELRHICQYLLCITCAVFLRLLHFLKLLPLNEEWP